MNAGIQLEHNSVMSVRSDEDEDEVNVTNLWVTGGVGGNFQAYDLAKKKGYLVQRAVSRKYPLINTYRNFCDASSQICIFIQQVQLT